MLHHQLFCSARQQILHGDLGPTLGLLVTQPKGPSEPPGYSQPVSLMETVRESNSVPSLHSAV